MTSVSKIIVKDGAAVGVVLDNGDYLTSQVVSSSVDPNLTFLRMVGAETLLVNSLPPTSAGNKYKGLVLGR